MEFGFLRTALELTAGNLGQHLSVLEKAELVHIEKGYEGKRPRTWVNLTPAGEKPSGMRSPTSNASSSRSSRLPRDPHGSPVDRHHLHQEDALFGPAHVPLLTCLHRSPAVMQASWPD